MTPIGRKIFIIYGLIVVTYLAFKSLRKLYKEDGGGFEAFILLPVIIFLFNLI